MDATYVVEISNRLQGPKVLSAMGLERIIAPPGWTDQTPDDRPTEELKVGTLTGLADFIREDVDGLDATEILLHVRTATGVELLSNLVDMNRGRTRHTYMAAGAPIRSGNAFNRFHDAESFAIWLQTGFVSTPALEELRAILVSIRENDVCETADDGVSQEVKTARGVAFVDRTKVPNPVALRPYRTFREIEQPESLFVMRLMRNPDGTKPQCALFEADGGVWELEAIRSIKKWLVENTSGVSIVA